MCDVDSYELLVCTVPYFVLMLVGVLDKGIPLVCDVFRSEPTKVAVLQEFNLFLIIYLSCFVGLILFILFVRMPMNLLLLLLLIRIRSPQLLSMLPTAQRQPQ